MGRNLADTTQSRTPAALAVRGTDAMHSVNIPAQHGMLQPETSPRDRPQSQQSS